MNRPLCVRSPEGNSASPVIVQQPVQPPPMVPKWPLKPGVLVHMNGARPSQGLGTSMPANLSGLPQTSTPIKTTPSNLSRSKSSKKAWNVQRRRALSLGSLAQEDDTSQRSRANRIRKMFSHDRSDSLPSGFYHGKSGGNRSTLPCRFQVTQKTALLIKR